MIATNFINAFKSFQSNLGNLDIACNHSKRTSGNRLGIVFGIWAVWFMVSCDSTTNSQGRMLINYYVHLEQLQLSSADSVVLDIYKDKATESEQITLIPDGNLAMTQIATFEGQSILVKARVYLQGVLQGSRDDAFAAGDRQVAPALQAELFSVHRIVAQNEELSLAPMYNNLTIANCQMMHGPQFKSVDECSAQVLDTGSQTVVLQLTDTNDKIWLETIQVHVQSDFTDSRDGQKYPFRTYGELLWMTKNMNIELSDSWCYQNVPENCTKYGRLYRYFDTTASAEKQICPENWRIPTEQDWASLEAYLGMEYIDLQSTAFGMFGTDEGNKLKSTSGWTGNGNGSNASGFTALPGGMASGDGLVFSGEGELGYWWVAREISPGNNLIRKIESSQQGIMREALSTTNRDGNALSVRCVRKNS
jgi:uncharacterized protein (TIGR02145 family)